MNIFKMLGEFSSLRKEIKETQWRIEKLRHGDGKLTSDVVKGSADSFPYVSHNVKVTGKSDFSLRITELEKILSARQAKLEEMILHIQKIIDRVQDSEIRRIMQFRYVDGLSYRGIAKAMGVVGDGSTERKKLSVYLKNIKK